jgi:type I restriction enzyme S subunit
MDRPWIEAGRKYAAVSEHDLPCLLVQRVARLRAKSSLDQRFLRYVIGSTPFTDHILGIQTGTAVPHISANQIRAYRFLKPPLDEQRAIGRILGALDDKIELNHRMNETLEATARTLFQSWFVEFDPVRAKAESRQPVGMDVEVAALFPYAFEDSALGPIPQGWTICPLSDTIAFTGGGTPKTSSPEYWGGEIPWFSVADAPRDSDVFVIDTEKRITQAGLENSSARMLRVGTTIISARGTVGRCAIVGIPMAMNQSCYGVNAGADRGDYFTYFSLRQDVADLKRSSHGSVFDTITRDTFERIDVACPPAELTVRYDDEVRNLMERILVNLKESRTLAATRDALLPRLLSGEVRAA